MNEKKVFTFEEIKQKLVNYCVYQDRCHAEVEQKMREFVLIPEAKEDILLYLMKENYLNEERFAQSYARGKFSQKAWGRLKIKQALKQKGIQERLISKAMQEIDETDYLRTLEKIISQQLESRKGTPVYLARQKMVQYLINRGFEYDLIKTAMNQDS